MKNIFRLLIFTIFSGVAMANEEEVGNKIDHHPELGHFMSVYDYRPETLEFMESNGLQGGGPTWMALIQAALELEAPGTLASIEFDDEADMVLVTSTSKGSLEVVQYYVAIIMSDPTFRKKCIDKASAGGYIE